MSEKEILPFPKQQRLRVPTGWEVGRNKFYDLEPKDGDLLYEDVRNGWSLFEQDLLSCFLGKLNIFLDMGWFPYYNPSGRYVLSLIENEDWLNRQTICETRSKTEIVEAVEQTMLRISRNNGDYDVEVKSVILQPLRLNTARWMVVKNELFEQLEPSGEMRIEGLPNDDGWQLMTENLLHLHWETKAKNQIQLGWFPAHDKSGAFRVLATNEKYFEPPLVDYSTRDKAEAIEIVEHLIKEIHLLKPLKK